MSIEPNSNHYNKDNTTKTETEEEVKNIETDDDNDDEFENKEEIVNKDNIISKEIFRARMIKLFIIVIIIFIVILLVGYLISSFSNKKRSYSDIEEIMVDAAKSYFNDNKTKLPLKNRSVYISSKTLENSKYMKSLDRYIKNENCSGKVVVKNISNSYDYTAYLDCGDNYKTRELYKEIIKKNNIVSNGYGLYHINNEYVYRGLYVNNYVAFKDKEDILWRIVKVLANNEIVLIKDVPSKDSYIWDERYNSKMEDSSGINVYKNSTVSTHLDKLYKSKYTDDNHEDYILYGNEEIFLTKKIKSKLKEFNSCVGVRSESDTSKDGSTECKTIFKTKMSLLSTYDFMNASIDPGCSMTTSPECQNYNYLSYERGYWLANGKAEDSSKVYCVLSGYIDKRVAGNDSYIRPVVHLNDSVMIEKGKGSKDNPYIIR